ncbi:MAG TPA: dienelactone hydrolase family protein [Pseudolabrys sp.]|nr:dienelactone hydrolase family protein [Pseudolabrys sp.]
MRQLYFAAAALLAMIGAAHAQDAASREIAARVELHSIQSLTISDRQFLTGDANGKSVTITGELRIAQGSGKLPVVVLMHGSGGMGPNIESWSRDLNAMGISTFALDGFTGRGLTSVSRNQALLGRLNFILDIYRSLDILAKHPRVDASRIALMGFSRGGQATLYASEKRFHQMWNKSGAEFAAYIPFYPDCMTTYISDTDVADKPIRIFQGTPDDYNPVAPCKKFAERLRAAGHDVVLTEYPNAWHAFDNPLSSPTPFAIKGAQSVRNCVIREEPKGVLINTSTGQPFTYKDACVASNPHINYDAEATRAAHAAVKQFLKTTFRLE